MTAAPLQISPSPVIDGDALLVALVLAPGTYARNKYFSLFQDEALRRVRRRAQLVRSILKDLTEPWPEVVSPRDAKTRVAPEATVLGEFPTEDGVRLVYRVEEFDYTRSALLTDLEAAALRYALSRAGHGSLEPRDRRLVEAALARLDPTSV
jgi:hypothetical protein